MDVTSSLKVVYSFVSACAVVSWRQCFGQCNLLRQQHGRERCINVITRISRDASSHHEMFEEQGQQIMTTNHSCAQGFTLWHRPAGKNQG
eukprot:811991-Amphidinium_carterae.2